MVSLRSFICGFIGLVGCAEHTRPTPAPVDAPAEVKVAAPEVVATPVVATPVAAGVRCAGPRVEGAESRVLAEWQARNPVEAGFMCPAALRVVQREEWWVPVTDLSIGVPDQLEGPTPRVNLGERIVYWGVDPGSGDTLTVSIGRLDMEAYAAALAKYPYPDHDTYSTPMLEDPTRMLGGAWRGLGFVPEAGAPVRGLRTWLAALPPGRVHSAPIDWSSIDWDVVEWREEVDELPRFTHVAGEADSTLCVATAETSRCWTTSPAVIVDVAKHHDDGKFLVSMGNHRVRSVWRVDSAAGTWEFAGGKPDARRFREAAAIAAVPAALAGHWIKPLSDETVVAGQYDYDSQGLAPSATLLARRHAQGWRIGRLDGDEVALLVEWRDPASVGVILGYDDARFMAFTVDGDWLAPAGRLPLPLRGMAALRGEHGWEYAYTVKAREPACLAVERRRSVSWESERGRSRPLELPMPDLAGEWSRGPEGLRRGCAVD